MSFNNPNPPREGTNIWSAGSRGSRGGFSRSDDDNGDTRGRGPYRGSFRGNYSRGGGGYGFRSNENDDVQLETLHDTIFIQNLPKNITRDEIQNAFSSAGTIKTDDRSGGPKIWIYKDRRTGEGNGRATVTYENEETANNAIAEYNDQHISSIDSVVHVQLAQRRVRDNNDGYNRGGFGNSRGYRGRGRSNWNNNPPNSGFYSGGGRPNRGRGRGSFGNRGGFRGGDGGSFYGNRNNSARGGSHDAMN